MSTHFADRLIDAIRLKNAPVCVGLDPLVERLPGCLLRSAGLPSGPGDISGAPADHRAASQALLGFGREVIEVVAPLVPAIKINIAFFERYYAEGIRAYFDLIAYAQDAGLIVIGDVKRADIGHSSTQYADAHLRGGRRTEIAAPDAVTVNPYFGFDAIRPFVEIARETGRGLFVLVQTSNESASEVQGIALSDGSTLGERVGKLVETWAQGEGLIGAGGYSCIGAVVAPRDLRSTERIRTLMPHCLFLVPGFGAQGRTARQVTMCFKPDGTGAIVNASRSVIYAYQEGRYIETFGDDWRRCVEEACKDLVRAVANAE